MPNIVRRIITFLDEVRLETKKVNWPTRQETIRSTLLVLVFAVGCALLLGFFDIVFHAILSRFLFL